MPRRPHLLSAREIVLLLAEHAVAVALLGAGFLVGAFLRDPLVPPVFDFGAWASDGAAAEHLTAFGARLSRFSPAWPSLVAWHVLAAAVLQLSMGLHGLHDRRPIRRARNLLLRLLRSAVVAGVAMAVVFFVARPQGFGRTALAVGYGLAVLLFWSVRSLAALLSRARPERLLVLGGPEETLAVEAAVARAEAGAWQVVGRAGPAAPGACENDRAPRLGTWDDVPSLLEQHGIDRVLLADLPPDQFDLGPLVRARLAGIAVASARDFRENLTGEVAEDDLGAEFITEGTQRAWGRVSRGLDIVLALGLLILMAPILLAAALLVLLTSGRPVLFAQQRIGLGGAAFTCCKLRTMAKDAEAAGPAWSPPGDPRVTRAGTFLRRWRIDELPQLWNVLRGDMAFVGPRPEQPFFVERLSALLPHYRLRHALRPGITGWAQVRHPYGASDEEARAKLRYDLFYIKHRSPWLDLAILFDTIRVVLRGTGR